MWKTLNTFCGRVTKYIRRVTARRLIYRSNLMIGSDYSSTFHRNNRSLVKRYRCYILLVTVNPFLNAFVCVFTYSKIHIEAFRHCINVVRGKQDVENLQYILWSRHEVLLNVLLLVA